MILRSKQGPWGRRLVLVAGLAASILVAGCDRETPTSRALDDARIKLMAMSSGEMLTAGDRTSDYQMVLSQLRPVASQGTRSQNAAAALLIAQAQAGLAEAPMAEAAELERRALQMASGVRAQLDHWQVMTSTAQAVGDFDPAPELNAIQQQTRERQQAISAAEATRADVEARVADLRKQSEGKIQQARSLHQEAGRLRQQVVNQSAIDGEQTLLRVREIARQADDLAVEASELEAEAEKIEPEVRQAIMQVEGIREQLDRLSAATAEVQGRASMAREHSSKAQAEATAVAQELHAAVNQLDGLRAGALAEKYQSALEGYASAASTARGAMSENRAGANLAVGAAQQAIGDLHWMRAHGLEFYHQALAAMAESTPALPQAQQYRQMADRVSKERQEALEGATEAFSAAYDAYSAAGAGDAMERVTQAIRRIVDRTSGGSRDLGAGLAMEMESLPAVDWPGGELEPGSTPEETLMALASASQSGDPGIIELFYAETPEQQQMLEAFVGVLPSYSRFTEALKVQFGPEAEQGLASMSAQAPGMIDFANLDPSQIEVDIADDRAEAQIGDGERIKLRQVDGRWLVDLTETFESPEAAMMTAMAPQLQKVFDDMATDIEAGKFNSEQEVFAALMTRIMSTFGGGG